MNNYNHTYGLFMMSRWTIIHYLIKRLTFF